MFIAQIKVSILITAQDNSSFYKLDEIFNNANIGIRGFTM